MPFYVAPEQVMKDRADYARKGIARGRALVAVRYVDGIAIVAENSSETLRKVSEIYDRIAFAGVGKYNEFDQLRVAGVRAADLKGFQYSRDDVDARSLANQYAQILGQIFTHEMKPMEVEILVAEVGLTPDGDQMFHILYDGTVFDQRDHTVLGGDADAILGPHRRVVPRRSRRRRRRRAPARRRSPGPTARCRRPTSRSPCSRGATAPLLPPAHRRRGLGAAGRRRERRPSWGGSATSRPRPSATTTSGGCSYTRSHVQLTVMSLAAGEDIGWEMHDHLDQFLRIEQGAGSAAPRAGRRLGRRGARRSPTTGRSSCPAGTWHDVRQHR